MDNDRERNPEKYKKDGSVTRKRNKQRQQKKGTSVEREQPRKDSKDPRVNLDNVRDSKLRQWKRDARKGDANDIAWYSANPELLRAAAQMGFSNYTGEQIQGTGLGVPGVMAMYWCPDIPEYAANIAANDQYSFVVHANSRNTRYNSPDLMILELAGMQVFSAIAAGMRAYGIMKKYPGLNAYRPDVLVRAMGFDANDLRSNLSQMWFDLNNLISQSKQIWIPNTVPLNNRWFWLNSNVYMDGNSAKDQYYLFVQGRFFQYSETSSSTGGQLVTVPGWDPQTSTVTWDAFVTMVQTMINALIDSEDRGIIFGDILKAYGEEKIFALNPITADFSVEPEYNAEVLTQIENCTITGSPQNLMLGVTQTNERGVYPLYGFGAAPTNAPLYGKSFSILNFHQADYPTADQIVIATRLTSLGYASDTGGTPESPTYNTHPAVRGTEVVYGCALFGYEYGVNGRTLSQVNSQFTTSTGLSVSTVFNWAAFDWAPWLYQIPATRPFDPSQTEVGFEPTMMFGDYSNWAVITMKDLQKLHTMASLSLFGVNG